MAQVSDVLPNIDHVRKLFIDVFGDTLTAGVSYKPFDKTSPLVVATYQDEWGKPRRYVAVDLSLAIGLGTSLSMLPADVAKEALAKKILPDHVYANLKEVLNICVNLFMLTADYRLVLKGVEQFPSTAASPLAGDHCWTLTFDITINNYPGGKVLLAYIPQEGEVLA